MGIWINNASSIVIQNLSVHESGGDGIYIGARLGSQSSRDVHISDVTLDKNYRQGMSVAGAVNMLVERCVFSNTAGTAPSAGVDIEPNRPTQQITNVSFIDCIASNNSGPGFAFYIAHFDSSTPPFGLLLDNYTVTSGFHYGIIINYIAPGVRGSMTVANSSVAGTAFGPLAIINKATPDSSVTVRGCDFDASSCPRYINISASRSIRPSAIIVAGYQNFTVGAVRFEDVTVRDSQNRPWLASAALAGQSVEDVSASGMVVHNQHGCTQSGPLHLAAKCAARHGPSSLKSDDEVHPPGPHTHQPRRTTPPAEMPQKWARCPSGAMWRDCPNIHNTGAGTVEACEALCTATERCTAINYAPFSCALRACPNGTEPDWTRTGFVGWASYPLACPAPTPTPPPPPPPVPPTPKLVSAALGSHMVLQRAPASARVWGSASPGAAVTVSFDGQPLPAATANGNGTWRLSLPPTAAGGPTHVLQITDGVTNVTLDDIVFGDVYLCGGQSNMVFAMPAIENATEEIAAADRYPAIRLFTVGEGTGGRTGAANAQADFGSVLQPWVRASSVSVASGGRFGLFSAVCWIFGRTVFDGLGGAVPIGLISSNWGGTKIESWSPDAVFEACPGVARGPLSNQGPHYNAMVAPLAHGPMALTGFAWYQAENNVQPTNESVVPNTNQGARQYACAFPALIQSWRAAFGVPAAYFGFVQLSTWCKPTDGIPRMRAAQMAALRLDGMVGYATNADHGAQCNIHPPPKQYAGARLGNSALALVYKQPAHVRTWKSPSFAGHAALPPQRLSLSAGAIADTLSVIVNVSGVSSELTADVYPWNYVQLARDGGISPLRFNCSANHIAGDSGASVCGWAAILTSDGEWLNATVSVVGSAALLFTSPRPDASAAGLAVVGSSYGWAAIPMLSVYDRATMLPLLPWNTSVLAP